MKEQLKVLQDKNDKIMDNFEMLENSMEKSVEDAGETLEEERGMKAELSIMRKQIVDMKK